MRLPLYNLLTQAILSSNIQCRLYPASLACSHTQLRAGMPPSPRLLNGKTKILVRSYLAAYNSSSCGSTTRKNGTPSSSRNLGVKALSALPLLITYTGYCGI